ncbi:hypothetical protein LF887_04215 [Chryseobacterium sp. MEBOG06]|uniref:hypothetical protein n=1 Tax=Chryseobacterium sp. MEBOG06 TaxID=2879938 RepID=UPI001F20F085|nr:hypothetical protein [Chryseobacterium sp. MEBOG06]UKB84848.1 hypothetical protein LF887_04215 [Chryseobacterium sp. MEBOG06]
MFRIFKKQKIKEFTDEEINFFRELVKLLPTRYHYILNQLNKYFLISFKPNDLNFKDWYSVQLNAKLEKVYSKPNLGYFQLQNIFIYNKKSKEKEKINISFLEGMFIGFFIKDINLNNYTLNQYDTSTLKEKHFKNENDKEVLLEIIKDVNKNKLVELDIEDTFKIEIPEGTFYTIKSLGEGNYLAVDSHGIVYELLHDPYSVKKKATSINDLL